MRERNVTGLVLAGGGSTRFGSDKSRFRIGETELRILIGRRMRAVAGRVLLSVGDARTAADPLPPPFSGIVADVFRGRGPLSGVHAGLAHGKTDWLLVAPCDMPDVSSETLAKLVDEATAANADAAVAAEEAGGRVIGVLACYHRRTLPVAAAMLESGRVGSMRGFVDALSKVRIVGISPAESRNVNRPEDAP